MIIGLTGYAQSGKDTVAQVLVDNYGFNRVSFADPIRKLLYETNPMLKEGYKFMEDNYDYITYINADILLTDDFCDTIEQFHKKFSHIDSCLLTAVRHNIFNFSKLFP